MSGFNYWVTTFISIILGVIGLAGIPDNVKTWKGWVSNIITILDGEIARWIFVGCAVFLILFVNKNQNPVRLLLSKKNREKFKIEFKENNNSSFYQRGYINKGNNKGYSYELYRIVIKNSNHFQNVEVKLVEIEPCPDYLLGRLPLWLQFQHEPESKRFIKVKPNDYVFVDVIQSTMSVNVSKLLIKHTVQGIPQELLERMYKIKIRASSENGSDEKWFYVGIEDLRLVMRPV